MPLLGECCDRETFQVLKSTSWIELTGEMIVIRVENQEFDSKPQLLSRVKATCCILEAYFPILILSFSLSIYISPSLPLSLFPGLARALARALARSLALSLSLSLFVSLCRSLALCPSPSFFHLSLPLLPIYGLALVPCLSEQIC